MTPSYINDKLAVLCDIVLEGLYFKLNRIDCARGNSRLLIRNILLNFINFIRLADTVPAPPSTYGRNLIFTLL